jgi:hypothetical protein
MIHGRSDGCPIYLLIVVHSAARNLQKRQVIRDTWANVTSYKGLSIRTVFVIGQTTDRNETRLDREQRKHGDILKGDFVDTYRNLTRKMVFWMQWVDSCCPDVEFIMKCDDDVVIVPETTIDFIHDQMSFRPLVLMGDFAMYLRPHRDPDSRWLITFDQWMLPYLPQFHQGYAQLMSKETLDVFNEAIRRRKIEQEYNATWRNFPVDDAFLGILADVCGVKLLGSPSFVNVFKPGKGDDCDICDKVAVLTESITQMRTVWCTVRIKGENRRPFKTFDNPRRPPIRQYSASRWGVKKTFLNLFFPHLDGNKNVDKEARGDQLFNATTCIKDTS